MATTIRKQANFGRIYDTARLPQPYPVADSDRRLFFNRELSLLQFNKHVLREALKPDNPLLERLKFLSIFSSNTDEFFMIRVSGLKEELDQGITELSPDGLTPAEQLEEIRKRLLPMIQQQSRCLTQNVLPSLKDAGIAVVRIKDLSADEAEQMEQFFLEKVLPVLTPLAVDRSHPFPYISPQSLNLGLMVSAPTEPSPADPPKFKFEPRFVRIKVPSVVPRLIPVSGSSAKFVFQEDLIAANVDKLFPGMLPGTCHCFRVTRDADIEIRAEEARDLLSTIREELRKRRFGTPVRLEVSRDMPEEMIHYLSEALNLGAADVYAVEGPLATHELMSLYDIDRPDLKDEPLAHRAPGWSKDGVFESIAARDILVHHPYDSYEYVTDFINAAVEDKDVVAIKMCLYRTGPESPIPPALIRAAEQGKQVTALIELKARFDEEHNIEWAQKLEEAGVHVVYGIVGLKTHSKLTLVVRREGDVLNRYVHIASGNYNPTTSCTYTDLGLFTTDKDIGSDATEIFNYLTGCSRQTEYRKLLVAPVNLRQKINELVDREINHQQTGRGGHIIVKLNRLADQQIIEKLYEASNAGVKIDLIIRGICMLRPGVEGLSENITVRTIVGRFLEHSRVYWFANAGADDMFIGSADWMSRNLKDRIEIVTPVHDAALKRYLRNTLLLAYLRDNSQASELQPDGEYIPIARTRDEEIFDSQTWFADHPVNRFPTSFSN
jgi:polyphosphate kinase